MTQYIPATVEEVKRRLQIKPKGFCGLYGEELRGCKILAIRTGPRIKKNVLIKPDLHYWQLGYKDLKERWVAIETLRIETES